MDPDLSVRPESEHSRLIRTGLGIASATASTQDNSNFQPPYIRCNAEMKTEDRLYSELPRPTKEELVVIF